MISKSDIKFGKPIEVYIRHKSAHGIIESGEDIPVVLKKGGKTIGYIQKREPVAGASWDWDFDYKPKQLSANRYITRKEAVESFITDYNSLKRHDMSTLKIDLSKSIPVQDASLSDLDSEVQKVLKPLDVDSVKESASSVDVLLRESSIVGSVLYKISGLKSFEGLSVVSGKIRLVFSK